METLLITLHVIIAIGLVGLILLQQGRGADMGSGFGSGGSQTVFGAVGAASVFAKATAALALLFMVSSFVLVVLGKGTVSDQGDLGIPAVIESAPVESQALPAEEGDGEAPTEPVEELPE